MIRQTDPHKRGRASRTKGARAERELAKLISETWGYPVRRGFTFHHESDLVGLAGIHCEVKNLQKLNIRKAMEQAEDEAEKRKDGLPTVFHRIPGGGWLVTMKLSDWIDLYGAWADGR